MKRHEEGLEELEEVVDYNPAAPHLTDDNTQTPIRAQGRVKKLTGNIVDLQLRGGVRGVIIQKVDFEIWVYQKPPPIGATFGRVSESLRLLRFALWPRP